MAILGNSLGTMNRIGFYPPLRKSLVEKEIAASRGPHEDLVAALAESPRRIPSKYFYDDEGSRLFVRITEQPEYYLTRCEDSILRTRGAEIVKAMGVQDSLCVVELGAGDAHKTVHLLEAAREVVTDLRYRPVDISAEALRTSVERLQTRLEGLKVDPYEVDLGKSLRDLPLDPDRPNLVLFLGSSVGNFDPEGQAGFLKDLARHLKRGDFLLAGFDLKKDPDLLRVAYDDARGVTREFNMNLLRRLNREFGADFDVENFRHAGVYNPVTGAMESWLVSLVEQTVRIGAADLTFRLRAYEGIHVETSWKFSLAEIEDLRRQAGFGFVSRYLDANSWFVDELWAY